MKSKYLLFFILITTLNIFVFLTNYFLVSDNIFFNTFAEQFTYEQIENLISANEKWQWFGYCIIPFVIALRITLVATCLSVGLYFITNRFNFKDLFGAGLCCMAR